jgi:GGDEF domain-containing protein
MIEDVARELSVGVAFVGHVGGDDFVVVVPPGLAGVVAQGIVERFDQAAPEFYDAEDRDRGFVEVTNRRGELQRFPILTISIGVASTEKRGFQHYAEAVAVATEMKQFTKGSDGSSWAMDRRTA